MEYITIYIIISVVIIITAIIIAAVSAYLSKKRLEEIVSELGLIQGNRYDVITNNGNKQLNLTYDRIAYGKNSQNGRINIYFTKNTKYRGTIINKEVMIKYANIWKIWKTSGISSSAPKMPSNQNIDTALVEDNNPPKTQATTLSFNSETNYYHKLQDIKEQIMIEFNKYNAKGVYELAKQAGKLSYDKSYDIVSLHYFYIEVIKLLYQLSAYANDALEYCLLACDLNINIYHDVGKEINDIYTEALTRKIKIYEKNNDYELAIAACDFGIKNGYTDTNKKSFQFRKDKLIKKLEKQSA